MHTLACTFPWPHPLERRTSSGLPIGTSQLHNVNTLITTFLERDPQESPQRSGKFIVLRTTSTCISPGSPWALPAIRVATRHPCAAGAYQSSTRGTISCIIRLECMLHALVVVALWRDLAKPRRVPVIAPSISSRIQQGELGQQCCITLDGKRRGGGHRVTVRLILHDTVRFAISSQYFVLP